MKYCFLFLFFSCLLPATVVLATEQDQDSTKKLRRTRLETEGILPGRNIISGDIAYLFGRVTDFMTFNNGALDFTRPVYKLGHSLSYSMRTRLFKRISLNTIFLYHFKNGTLNAPWLHSDFYYSLDRLNYLANTFSYGYYNYEINKYGEGFQKFSDKFLRGVIYINYNHLPRKLINKIRWNKTAHILFTYSMRYSYKSLDPKGNFYDEFFTHKPVAAFSTRITLVKNIYIESGIFCYIRRESKLAWDPDFTYGFGYSNWKPFTLSFIYYNGVINRFLWNREEIANYGFIDGTFVLSYKYKL